MIQKEQREDSLIEIRLYFILVAQKSLPAPLWGKTLYSNHPSTVKPVGGDGDDEIDGEGSDCACEDDVGGAEAEAGHGEEEEEEEEAEEEGGEDQPGVEE